MEEDVSPPSPTFFQKYGLALGLGGVSIFCIVASLVLLFKTTQTADPIRFSGVESSGSAQTQEITVDIEGAVAKPGVYRIAGGSRIEDLLLLAGGLTRDADAVWVGKTLNRAALLLDGGKLFIPEKGTVSSVGSISTEGIAGAVSAGSTLISINSATTKELDTLPGVGEVTAGKIITGRPYQTMDELLSRKIVGQAVFEKIRSLLTL